MPVSSLEKGTKLHSYFNEGEEQLRFEITKKLGSNTFENAYLASDAMFEDICVIKEFAFAEVCRRDLANIIVPHENKNSREDEKQRKIFEKWLARFETKAKKLSKISHKNIASIRLIWRERGTVFYAISHVENGQLTTQKNWKPKSWPEVEEIAFKLLDAIEEIHEIGLLHGDIKPENILISPKGNTILTNFGKAWDPAGFQTLSSANIHVYTSDYAPPEFHKLKEISPSSDLYSWAITIVSLLAQHPNTNDGEPMDMLSRYQNLNHDPYSNLASWLPNLPSNIVEVLQKCLKLDHTLRPKNVAETRNLFASKPMIFEPASNKPIILEHESNKPIILEPESNKPIILEPAHNETKFQNHVPQEANRIIEKLNKEISLAIIPSRFIAKIIDILPFGLIFIFSESELFFLMLFLILGLLFITQIYFLAKDGQTIGKKIMKIKIVDVNDQPVKFWKILVFKILFPITIIIFINWFTEMNPSGHYYNNYYNYGLFFLLLTIITTINILPIFNTNRCIHDFLAKTKVVKEESNKETLLATIQSRFIAKIIDILPFGLMFFLPIESFFLMLGLLSMIQIFFLAKDGQTIGRKLMKIKIVRMNDQPVSFWRILFLRSLPIAIVIFIAWFIEMNSSSRYRYDYDLFFLLLTVIITINILPIFDTNRCIHDFFADTKVVKE